MCVNPLMDEEKHWYLKETLVLNAVYRKVNFNFFQLEELLSEIPQFEELSKPENLGESWFWVALFRFEKGMIMVFFPWKWPIQKDKVVTLRSRGVITEKDIGEITNAMKKVFLRKLL